MSILLFTNGQSKKATRDSMRKVKSTKMICIRAIPAKLKISCIPTFNALVQMLDLCAGNAFSPLPCLFDHEGLCSIMKRASIG